MPVDPRLLQELHDRLGEQLSGMVTGEEWLAFLRSSRQFHRYSPQNQMLLVAQGAQGHVASYRTWQRIGAVGGGRCQVRKGETGMVILAPMTITRRDVDEATGQEMTVAAGVTGFKSVKVFHQGQLVAPPDLVGPPLPKLLTGDNRHQHVWAAVQSHLEDLGYDVELVARSPVDTWNGRTDFTAAHVAIADYLPPPARLKTLIHEWSHIALGHDQRLAGQRDLQEVEAESVTYLVCGIIGMDSAAYSVPYLAGWSAGDVKVLDATAQRVLGATGDLVAALESELSIDLTPDLLRDERSAASVATLEAAVEPAAPRVFDVSVPATPLLDAAGGEQRAVLAGLVDENERHRFRAALDDIDRQLDTVVELCAAAGFSSQRTARMLLGEHHVDPSVLMAAMMRDELDHHPLAPDVPAADRRQLAAHTRELIETLTPTVVHRAPTGALERLSPGDRDLLERMDLRRRDHLAQAARVLADAGLDLPAARDVLTDLAVPPATVHALVHEPHYNPATGRHEPLWSTDGPAPSLVEADGHQPASPTPLTEEAGNRPPPDVVLRVAATGDPERLVQLGEAFGLEPAQAIMAWAGAGVTVDMAAKAAISACGSLDTAVAELSAYWPAGSTDWGELVHAEIPDGVTAHRIVRQWADLRSPARPAPAPEMA